MPSDFANEAVREAVYYQGTGQARGPLSGQNLRSAVHAIAAAQLMITQVMKESGILRDGALSEVEPMLASMLLDLRPTT